MDMPLEMNQIIIRPNLRDVALRSQLAKGMGHNTYGEIAWPNDLLYIFPVTILGVISACVGFAVMSPTPLGEHSNPFATPLEILPEWFLFPTFHILRVIPNKLVGIGCMISIPLGLMAVPFVENLNRYQNPIRRPAATLLFLASSVITIFLGIEATQPLG